jgi:hypothetical protein
MQLPPNVLTSFKYPHKFPPTPQSLGSPVLFGLDAGAFLYPRWQQSSMQPDATVVTFQRHLLLSFGGYVLALSNLIFTRNQYHRVLSSQFMKIFASKLASVSWVVFEILSAS